MEKKINFDAFVSSAGKAAKDLFGNAVTAIDQNDDGKLDMADVSVIAEAMGSTVKRSAISVMKSAGEKAKALELQSLHPLFPVDLDDANFLMPKFIRVVERDKRYAESEVCQGSIGFASNKGGLDIVNIFLDSIDAFGLTFYPDSDCDFYYVDPTDRNRYIALDEYFNYLKIARINELKRLAQDLGAKHFKITYKEEQATFSENKSKAHVKAVAKADAEHRSTEKRFSTVEIAAEMDFPGHAPIKPTLRYMQRDPSIQTLIAMRMDESAPLLHEKYVLKMSTSSGMKETDAVKIDTVLKSLKVSGNATVASEARNESRRYLEYEINF